MSYIVNPTVVQSLTIGGKDVTDNLVSWTASDSSANRNGCVITTGAIVLTANPGTSIEDYDRNMFVRGNAVRLTMTGPNGSFTHPRGLLYVMTSAYNPETESIDITTGCKLAMYALNDDASALLGMVPLKLDPAQETFQACCAAFSANGQYVYQNNGGSLRVYNFWGSSSSQFTSILGTTTTAVQPLAGGDAIPQSIKLSYQVPEDGTSEDERGKVEITETESYYFILYPVVNYKRIPKDADEGSPDGNLDNIGDVENSPTEPPAGGSNCGNTPPEPEELEESDDESCTDGYELKQQPIYVPARRRDITTSTYDGPGAQLSMSHQQVFAPEFEANSQYFADKFAFCRATWASRCNPNGSCRYAGLGLIKVGETFTYNYYGAGNELVKQIVDTYATRLSAAKPNDWRSGVDRGIPQGFKNSFNTANQSLFLATRVETDYARSENKNVQIATTYTTMTSRGTGISVPGSIDAMSGIVTKTIRRSTTISTLEVSPDIINSPTTSTEEKETIIGLGTSQYVNGFNDYVIETQLPVPIFFEEGDDLARVAAMTEALVRVYGSYLKKFIKGDAFGLQIGESMVRGIESYRPGYSFRYVDNSKGEIVAMKMDATVWGADLTSSGFVTNGMWSGFSNGTATVPNNLYGNATPSLDLPTNGGGSGGGTIIYPPITPPTTDPGGSGNQVGDTWQPDPNDPTELYVWDGTQWVLVPPIVDPNPPVVQPPADLEVGDVWQDDDGTLYIWDGTNWVESTNTGTGVVPPTTRPDGSLLQVGDTWVDDDGVTHVWDGDDWEERTPIVDTNPPTDTPGNELEVGDTWIDNNGDIYIWDGTTWQPAGTNTPPNTPPTTRPDGSPLQPNDVWQNADGELYVWDGSTWVLDEDSTPIGEPPPPVDPDVEGETGIDQGDIVEYIDVHWMFYLVAETPSENGIVPPPAQDLEINVWRTMTTYVSGMIVGSGDLLSTEADGRIPIEYNGILVIQGANVVDVDVFS